MLDLQTIKNPFVRRLTGATALFSIVTIVAAVAIGLVTPEDSKANNKLGVYSALLGLVSGGIIGELLLINQLKKRL